METNKKSFDLNFTSSSCVQDYVLSIDYSVCIKHIIPQ